MKSFLKGLLERMFLLAAFVNNLPTALVVFGTLKLGTRLKHTEDGNKEDENKFNDFFLMGNFISMLVAIGYKLLWDFLMK